MKNGIKYNQCAVFNRIPHIYLPSRAHRSSKWPFSRVKQISAVLLNLLSLTLIVQKKDIYVSIRELYFRRVCQWHAFWTGNGARETMAQIPALSEGHNTAGNFCLFLAGTTLVPGMGKPTCGSCKIRQRNV